MTEQAAATRRPGRRRPGVATVALMSLAAFLAILAFLAFEVRTGHDPALSAQAKVADARQPQRIIVRRVEDDYVITKVIPAPGSNSAQPALSTGSSGGGVSTSSPVVVSSPAPAVTAIPAPVTRTS